MNRLFRIGIGSLIVFAALAAPARLAAAGHTPTLQVILQVPGRSTVPLHLVVRAKAEVERIYQDAGINISWIDPFSGTSQPESGPRFGLVVLPPEVTEKLIVSPDALGGATGTPEDRGRMAYVFYDRVERIAETHLNASRERLANVETVIMLGHAMAHEIGHLLLPHGHSASGLMRADWDQDDLRSAIDGELNFTAEQAELLRARLSMQQDAD